MVNLTRNKLGLIAAGSALALALASVPAKAHHGHSIVGPAVAFIALGALLHHGHHYGHHGHYRHHRHHYKHHHRHYYKHHRRHSHSHGGYHYKKHAGYHKKRRKHYNH